MSTMTSPRQQIKKATAATGLDVLFLVEYGSRAYGTDTAHSDHDLLGVYVEHDHQLYGLDSAETQNYRLHATGYMEQMGVSDKESPSGPDVIEMGFHPLRKFVRLAAAGNPTVLSTLWTPFGSREGLPRLDAVATPASHTLFERRNEFLSKHAGFRHAGYARAQRDALLGITNKRTNRPALIQQHGYDTKYASHMIRLLLAGLHLVRERSYELPMRPGQLELVRDIRQGQAPLDDLLAFSERLENELVTATEQSNLPDSVDYGRMNDLLRQVRNEHLHR